MDDIDGEGDEPGGVEFKFPDIVEGDGEGDEEGEVLLRLRRLFRWRRRVRSSSTR